MAKPGKRERNKKRVGDLKSHSIENQIYQKINICKISDRFSALQSCLIQQAIWPLALAEQEIYTDI
jgi:hypothetical protein